MLVLEIFNMNPVYVVK